ncbi:MAG: hypothetical protein PHP94_00675 [Eubacteriales bacterium]|nr:hypothetical protein [Eubacteriales bacterium]
MKQNHRWIQRIADSHHFYYGWVILAVCFLSFCLCNDQPGYS